MGETTAEDFLAKLGDLLANRLAQHATLHEPEGKTVKIKSRKACGA